MAIDTAEKRWTTLIRKRPCARRLPWPTGANLDTSAERLTALGIYGGYSVTIGSVGSSSGARQRCRRIGLLSRP